MALIYLSFFSIVIICVVIVLLCRYYRGCRYYHGRNAIVTPTTTYVVGQNNVAYYDSHGNPIVLSPNHLVNQNPNLHPPQYQYQNYQQYPQQPQPNQAAQPQPYHPNPAVLVLQQQNISFEDFQVEGLHAHNTFRRQHGSPLMALDSDLNKAAQDCAVYYAQKRQIDHTCVTEGAGENLYSVWGGIGNPNLKDTVKKAIQAWYDEKATYNFEFPGLSTGVTGHFTQLVWKESTLLGIGAATINGYTAVVAKYKVHGNIQLAGADMWEFYKENVKRSIY